MLQENILHGVGRKMRSLYLNGQTSQAQVVAAYKRNKKEADAFCPLSLTYNELRAEYEKTHNPLLRDRLQHLMEEYKQKSRRSNDQNQLSLQKLAFYRRTALGCGLRKVMSELRKISKDNLEAEVILLLIEIEFANLTAKLRPDKKSECYERKDLLLFDASFIMKELGWRAGISYSTGKNANYLCYFFLGDGTQISYHCCDYNIMYYYDEIDCQWDGKACSTLEKLLSYSHQRFGIGEPLIEFEQSEQASAAA